MENQTTEITTNTEHDTVQAILAKAATMISIISSQYDKINKLEARIGELNSTITNMQNTHNHLADIAFDEGKFTEFLMDKVDEAAREAARDTIDIDEIAERAAGEIDISDEVERCVGRLDLISEDRLDSALDSRDYKNESEVEDLIENYIEYNCDFASKSDFHDYMTTDEIEERLEEIKEEIIEEVVDKVVAAIVSKLTGKENDHATDSRDNSIQVSGVNGSSEATSSGVVITS